MKQQPFNIGDEVVAIRDSKIGLYKKGLQCITSKFRFSDISKQWDFQYKGQPDLSYFYCCRNFAPIHRTHAPVSLPASLELEVVEERIDVKEIEIIKQ